MFKYNICIGDSHIYCDTRDGSVLFVCKACPSPIFAYRKFEDSNASKTELDRLPIQLRLRSINLQVR